ncbi:MAG: glutaredoxin domain-containing protein [Atopobiaceae bacterium]|jgi:glutaredoxin-related protein
MLTIYATMQCPDCRAAVHELSEKGMGFTLVEIEELKNLKRFMNVRDAHPGAFAEVKNKGIGVPCFVKDDGTVTLGLEEALA